MQRKGLFLWYLQESNQGHMDFQSIALPTELRYQPFCIDLEYVGKLIIELRTPLFRLYVVVKILIMLRHNSVFYA